MDSVPFAVVSVVVAGLCTALAVLWKIVMDGNRKCEERDARHESEKASLKEMLFKRLEEERKRAEEREERANRRTHEFAVVLSDTKEVIMRTVRLLRRYDPNPTPQPDVEDQALEPTPTPSPRNRRDKRGEPKSDETSHFFNTAKEA